jgi:hypothetical protein
MNTPKLSAVAQVITVDAYQRPSLVVYAILVVFLALVECGIVITGITLVISEIDVLTTIVAFTSVALLFAIPFIWLLRYYLKELQEYRAIEKGFAEQGIIAEATVVGKEEQELGESVEFLIVYQFRSDFQVRAKDDTWEMDFWKLPLGSKVSITYLPDAPMISKLNPLPRHAQPTAQATST